LKIIHTGDVHIGSALKNLPPEKARLRQSELTDGFRRLCDYARDNGVSCVDASFATPNRQEIKKRRTFETLVASFFKR
jgi:hypothetical protein